MPCLPSFGRPDRTAAQEHCAFEFPITGEERAACSIPVGWEHMFVSTERPPTRRCARCRQSKPESAFAWHRQALGRRQPYCRECQAEYKREHYAANRARYVAQTTRRKDAVNAERTEFLVDFFRTHPCVDCGEIDPVVLEFDHIGAKEFDISSGIRARKWQAVINEIAKCEVVCANCHRRRTALRGDFARVLAQAAASSRESSDTDPHERHG
jgi:hypothetical protein